nr:hypothetical protein [Tanacetum cinerariifolium]
LGRTDNFSSNDPPPCGGARQSPLLDYLS